MLMSVLLGFVKSGRPVGIVLWICPPLLISVIPLLKRVPAGLNQHPTCLNVPPYTHNSLRFNGQIQLKTVYQTPILW